MVQFDVLDYGVYYEGTHIADFEELAHAKMFAQQLAIHEEEDVVIVNNHTGEIVTEFVVKLHTEIVEVEP